MIVLASRSPRRKQLLEMLGIEHDVEPAHIHEDVRPGEPPQDAAVRLAREKALHVAARRQGSYVLGADTLVVLDGEVIGKPESPVDAELTLTRLSGNEHHVVTAVALAKDGSCDDRCDVTRVWFRKLDPAAIRAYIATGDPLDKAGSYGVQGLGAVLIERIDGDFFSVMGLPVRLVVELLDAAAIPYRLTRKTGTA